jgi:hypothetical protein
MIRKNEAVPRTRRTQFLVCDVTILSWLERLPLTQEVCVSVW